MRIIGKYLPRRTYPSGRRETIGSDSEIALMLNTAQSSGAPVGPPKNNNRST